MIDHDAEPAGELDDVPEAYYEEDCDGKNVTPFSEDALALEYVDRNCHRLKWTEGMGWFRDSGSRWASDKLLRRFSYSRELVREVASKLSDKQQGIARKIASKATVNNIVDLACSDSRIVLSVDAWDSDPMALNTPGGVVDLRSGLIRPRAGDFFTQCTEITPDPDMPMPVTSNFLSQIFEDDEDMVEFVRRVLGYFITADRREQKIFFAHGVGSNGKSTLFDLFRWVCGTYALKIPPSVLMVQKVPAHSTELAQLRGKRIAISSELEEGSHWAEARIKELTGEETLNARVMRGDPFEFTQTQKHLIVGNFKPRLRGGDPAVVRRFVLIPFAKKFEGSELDMSLPTKLRSEAPAFLSWIIGGARDWYENGIGIPAKVQRSSQEYMETNDDIAMWLSECCVMESGSPLPKASELYESFADWIKSRGQFACSLRVWGERMSIVPGVQSKTSNGVRYIGVRLSQSEKERMASLKRGGW